MVDFRRTVRHLLTSHWQVRRAFPKKSLDAITQAIRHSESAHDGEIRFAVESGLSGTPLYQGKSARERAIDVFSELRMWDTEHRNGVLIYLLMADRSVEIVADRGVHAKTGTPEWEKICHAMECAFHDGNYETGAIQGIQAVTHLLTKHFPASGARRNELPDEIVVL